MKSLKPISRIIILLCALAIIPTVKLPLWEILLEAPQYPEGMQMQIWADKITGDVNKINGLNHYIGMALIEEKNFPELQYMTYIILGMSLLALIVAATGKKWMLWISVAYQLVCGIYGMYDFWKWEYDYGHNLNPHAAIKIPGMSYQPPLIGWKQLLNFLSGSFPDIGGWIIIASSVIVISVLAYELFFRKK